MIHFVIFQEGVVVVGGNSRYEVPFCLKSLAYKQQCIMGVSKGSREQLYQLVDLVAKGEVSWNISIMEAILKIHPLQIIL